VYSIASKCKTLAGELLPLILVIICWAAIPEAGSSREAVSRSVERQLSIRLPSNLVIPHYAPGPAPFHSGDTLIYSASWLGIPAAEARVVVLNNGAAGHSWTGRLWLRSSAAVDVLYRMRDFVSEDFNSGDLRPREMHISQHEKQRRDEWTIRFDDQQHLVTSMRKNAQGRTWLREFSGGEPWGPFSGAMLALSLHLTVGQTYTFDVFSGGNRYVFAFTVDKREVLATPLGMVPALRIIPSVVWLSEGKFRSQVSQAVVWVMDDERHLPLRIEAEVFIGTIRVDLVQVGGIGGAIGNASLKTVGPGSNQSASPLLPLSSSVP
jgi:hypothetical protein